MSEQKSSADTVKTDPSAVDVRGITEPSAEAAGSSASFMPFSALRSHAWAWIGIACLMAWIELLFCFEGVLRDQVESSGGLVHDPFFYAATLVAAVVFFVIAIVGRHMTHMRIDALLRGRGVLALVVTVVGDFGAVAAVILTDSASDTADALPYICGAVSGLLMVWGICAWGHCLSGFDLRESLLVISLAACLQWVVLVAVPVMALGVQIVLMALLPLMALIALWRIQAKQTDNEADTSASAYAPHSTYRATARRAAHHTGDSTMRRLIPLAITMFIFSAVSQCMWSYFIKMLPGKLDTDLFSGIFAAVIAVTALTACIAIVIMERQHSYRLELFYRAMMLFCLLGVAATGVAAANELTAGLFITYALVYIGYSLAGPMIWLLALGFTYLRRESPLLVFGVIFGCNYLGLFCGFAAVGAMEAGGLADVGQEITPLVVFIALAVLAVVYLLVFPERSLLSLSPLLFGMSSESVENRCAQIAREYGLTPRETEVLTMLARGRDVGYICRVLYIARNTANAHRKNIYAKLGIHSQQELLSLVEQANPYER